MKEWIKKLGENKHDGILSIHITNEEILPFAAIWMDLEGIMLSKTSQTEDKHLII